MTISILPDDILLLVFGLVGKGSSLVLGLVSKRWHWIAMKLWKGRLSLVHPGYVIPLELYANVTRTARLPYELYGSGNDDDFLEYVLNTNHAPAKLVHFRANCYFSDTQCRQYVAEIMKMVPTPAHPTARVAIIDGYDAYIVCDAICKLHPSLTGRSYTINSPPYKSTINWTM
jgi:hypothetical protein